METSSPSILFMGTPCFAATALSGLVEAGFNIIGVITMPDKKTGRGSSSKSKKVAPFHKKGATFLEAEVHNIPIYEPATKAELSAVVGKVAPELIVVAAFGMIIPQTVLDIPKYGALNIHGSLLPKYRGASPIPEAILQGDTETGITIMQMSAGMDEGPIISQFALPIVSPLRHPYESEDILGQAKDDNPIGDTTASLTEKMAKLGAKAIVETIPSWVSGKLKATPQDNDKATYCKKITKEDGRIDWNKPAAQIERMIRAYTPWPSAYTFVGKTRIKITKAGLISGLPARPDGRSGGRPRITGEIGVLQFDSGHIYVNTNNGVLEILELQPEGKKPMSAKEYINGIKR